MSSHPARRGPHALAGSLLALSLALAGCAVRLDTPPPALPSPDAAETARQGTALRALDIAALAEDVPEPAREGLADLAADSRAHADALGGLWSPPDWATTAAPSGTPEPSGTEPGQDGSGQDGSGQDEPTSPTTADVAAALVTAATRTCADAVALEVVPGADGGVAQDSAAQDDDGGADDLVTLLASICLAQRQQAILLGADPGELTGRPEPSERSVSLAAALARSAGAPALARELDAAGFALEVVAARSVGTARSSLAALAGEHRDVARDVLEAAGVLGTTSDPRRAAYSLEDPGALDPGAIEAGVLAAWTAVVASAPPDARAAILAEMDATARLAGDWGAPSSTFPGLPGLPGLP